MYGFLMAGWGLKGVIIGETIGISLFVAGLLYFYHAKFIKVHTVQEKGTFPLRRLFRYGGYSFFNQVGGTVLDVSTDIFVISAFLGPVAAGIYGFADKITNMFSQHMPHVIFQDVIAPAFFTSYAKNGTRDIDRMFNILTKLAAFLAFPLVCGIVALGDKMILYVFGEKYLDSYLTLCIMAAFTAVNVCANGTGLVLKAIEKVDVLLYGKIFAVYNLVAELLVVQRYGVAAVAIATGSAVMFERIYYYICAKRRANLVMDWKGMGKILFNSLVMGVVVWFVRGMVTGIVSLIGVVLLGAAVYFAMAILNKGFSAAERELANKVIARRWFYF
jgi:O-antigen/teichoic acid export membrane protein